MYPLISGHSASYNRNVKMRAILFILYTGLFIIGVQFNFSNLFLVLINAMLFVILCLEQYSLLKTALWFILFYIINYNFPYSHLIV